MCNLYSHTKGQQAIREPVKAMRELVKRPRQKPRPSTFVILLALLTCGCVGPGTTGYWDEKFLIHSTPLYADCTVLMGGKMIERVHAPKVVTLPTTKEEIEVTCEHKGYKPTTSKWNFWNARPRPWVKRKTVGYDWEISVTLNPLPGTKPYKSEPYAVEFL